MTGPEHYREAERLIGAVTHRGLLEPGDHSGVLALAQVHATLALAAATAILGPVAGTGYDDHDLDAWRAAAATPPSQCGGPCACDHHGDHAGCGADCGCAT
ncbi:hypothetical protein [Nonomuraea indica]|uniref:hypothetical protein n=1 Tax=Nonomuraea indica TaxID=1581193 RepID=UPI000C7AEE85|nr:hypothetical protein [Nonomuraea indica]